jgi:arylsulfatase
MFYSRFSTLLLTTFCGFASLCAPLQAKPNIILIMVDDMGFSDLGCYGSEIATPNIDSLAAGGVRFAQFTNGARCCPTRASLLTGLHPHQTGIGHMTNSPDNARPPEPAPYQGYLNQNCATIAELIKPAGYTTLMTGKWHLGIHHESRWPKQRGFDRYYGCLSGATRFFSPIHPRGMTDENTPMKTPKSTTDKAFYTTDAFTDHAIRFITESTADRKKPFFLYLAYTAPHWPLHAFEEDIAKYRGKYKIGWDKLRSQRYKKQLQLGLMKPEWKLSPRNENADNPDRVPAWDSFSPEKQDEMDLQMAVYAAMIDRVDQNIGKLIDSLKSQSLYENTLILFLSDNGACHEGGTLGRGNFYDIEKRNLDLFNAYSVAWANAGNTPFRKYKRTSHQGGTATPLIIHWPKAVAPLKQWVQTPAHITDVVPTILELAGATYPKERNGNKLHAIEGKSLVPAFAGKSIQRDQALCLEHQGNAFVRDGKWKLVSKGSVNSSKPDPTRWELYNIDADRTELNDLAATHPEKRDALIATWESWAKEKGVFPKPINKRKKKQKRPAKKAK